MRIDDHEHLGKTKTNNKITLASKQTFEQISSKEDLKDTYRTVQAQYGVDPLEGHQLTEAQRVLVAESESGSVPGEVLDKAVQSMRAAAGSEADPKKAKEMQKKAENLAKVSQRPPKSPSFELEEKHGARFAEVDRMIGGLGQGPRRQLLRNVYINENPKWHPERNSLVHIKIVTSRGIETGDDDLMAAGIFHDIAKFDTVSLNSQGWPTSLGHDRAGAAAAAAAGQNDTVVYICSNHMKVKGWKGDSEGGTLNPSTKLQIFNEAPGEDPDRKAAAFWKLCVFSKMDDMAYDFDASRLRWDNPTLGRWDQECPLREEFKGSELVPASEQAKQDRPPAALTAQELMALGAKGPRIREVMGAIAGLGREEAMRVAKEILAKNEGKRWIRTYESFRRG